MIPLTFTILFLALNVMSYPWPESSWQSPTGSQFSSSSSNVGSGGFSSTSMTMNGSGPLKARIIVRNRQIINLSTGNGSVSTSLNPSGVHINVNGLVFDSPDVIGPYVVTNEEDPNVLKRRDFTPEDEQMINQHEQAMAANWNAMNQQFQNSWNQMFNSFSNFGMRPMMPMQPFPSLFGR